MKNRKLLRATVKLKDNAAQVNNLIFIFLSALSEALYAPLHCWKCRYGPALALDDSGNGELEMALPYPHMLFVIISSYDSIIYIYIMII